MASLLNWGEPHAFDDTGPVLDVVLSDEDASLATRDLTKFRRSSRVPRKSRSIAPG